MKIRKENIGSRFDDWLKEEGIYDHVTSAAIKRTIADQMEEAMTKEHVSKTEMAKRMHTSRASPEFLILVPSSVLTDYAEVSGYFVS